MEVEMGTLHCTFIDRRTSVPLGGARATCVWRNAKMTWGDADAGGRFTLTLPQGVYDIVLSARGYLSLTLRGIGVLAGSESDIVRALVPGDGGHVEGEPATAIGGFVVDRLGHPIGSAPVHILSPRNAYAGSTDGRGAYVIHGVAPDTYEVRLGHPGRMHVASVDAGDVKQFTRLDASII